MFEQKEFFPPNSPHHSQHGMHQRHEALMEESESGKSKSAGRPVDDMTGDKVGYLKIIQITDERIHGSVVYICECDCGMIVKQPRNRLYHRDYPITHCGCQGVGKARKPKPGALSVGSRYSRKFSSGIPGRKLTPVKSIRANYRYNAAKWGHEFELSLRQFKELLSQDCHYCGATPSQEYKRNGGSLFLYNGIDRVDNNKGYTDSNCVPCCKQCNYFKGTLSQEEFRQVIINLYNRWASN
jgi:hypothetical protein